MTCNTIQNHAIPFNTMDHHTIPYDTIRYNAIPCNTILSQVKWESPKMAKNRPGTPLNRANNRLSRTNWV